MLILLTLFRVCCVVPQEMVFPFISGPVEGLLLIVGFALTTYAKGVSWWHQV